MSAVIFLKLLIGGTAIALAAASTGIGLNWDKIIGNVQWVVYAKVGPTISNASSKELPTDGSKRYQCKMDWEFECTIKKLKFENNQWDFSTKKLNLHLPKRT